MATYCMGLQYGLDDPRAEVLRNFRWLFQLDGIIGSDDIANGVYSLPPREAGRPHLQFRTQELPHLTETIAVPVKPEWPAVQLVLFDVKRCGQEGKYNPVYQWLRRASTRAGDSRPGAYDPQKAEWTPHVTGGLKRTSTLLMLDGCGEVLETWKFENSWPESVDWGSLSMDLSDVVKVSVTLRFDRAYQEAR